MTAAVEQLLTSFDALTDVEKQAAVAELLRRVIGDDSGSISDEALSEIADERFNELDAREAADEGA
jgi:hypothetical protein